MKSMKVLMVLAAAAMVAAPAAQASNVVLDVEVPFDFVIADQQLPSGAYRFVQEQGSRLVQIYSKDNAHVAAAHWVPMASGEKGASRLVFQKCGNQRFLKMIRAANGGGAYLPTTRAEKVALASAARGTTIAQAR